MATQYVIYATKQLTRWDTIAQWAYGNCVLIEPIISANIPIPINAPIPAGVNVLVPIRDDSADASLPSSQLPPWA